MNGDRGESMNGNQDNKDAFNPDGNNPNFLTIAENTFRKTGNSECNFKSIPI